jgi:hypothetical protein
MNNPRNKKRVALIIPMRVSLSIWSTWNDGIFAAFNVLAEKYNVKVFGYSDHPATIKIGSMYLQVVHNISSLNYWLASFNPDYIFSFGDTWDGAGNYNCKKIFIGDGTIPTGYDEVLGDYIAVNTDEYKPMELNRLFPSFYPMAIVDSHRLWAVTMPPGSLVVGEVLNSDAYATLIEHNHVVLPTVSGDIYPYLYNQSQGVCITALNGGTTTALEALACNTPVLVIEDNPISAIPGVWVCPNNEADITNAYFNMIMAFNNGDFDLRDEYIVGKYDHTQLTKKLIGALNEK